MALFLLPVYFFFIKENKKINSKVLLACIALNLLGILYVNYQEYHFSSRYNNGEIVNSGTILACLSEGDYFNKYLFKSSEGEKFLVYINNSIEIDNGNIIEFHGEFKRPNGIRNKGCFDYSKYLYSQGIYGSIYIYNEQNIQVVDNNKSFIGSIKDSIVGVYSKIFPKEIMRCFNRNDYWRYILY